MLDEDIGLFQCLINCLLRTQLIEFSLLFAFSCNLLFLYHLSSVLLFLLFLLLASISSLSFLSISIILIRSSPKAKQTQNAPYQSCSRHSSTTPFIVFSSLSLVSPRFFSTTDEIEKRAYRHHTLKSSKLL